ncbi:U-box domain [Dillenia turbinata]|uniref:RING-type E3 ubiquitin transferase n=1 Tax=Dillenia turbinata TaxID=194707 RepID=A0AAN8V974_9MAGN
MPLIVPRFRIEVTLVEVLRRVRHPNLVTLLETCPETRSIIYEYLINGSFEDQLSSRGKRPLLEWQTRTQIAADIYSALLFLHSNKPCITHGNLKPGKVLLDANFTREVGGFGTSSLMPQDENSAYNNLQNDAIKSMVFNAYLDPEYICSGKLTPVSDVYSFGVISLQLIIGRAALGIVRDLKCALEKDNLDVVVDSSAGNWPLDQAKHCCEERRSNQADLESEVWPVLELIMESCNDTEFSSGSKENCRAPSHFFCPIYQEVMKDPQIAADGYTYEADAIKGWFNSGHNTSPMTNLKLPNCDLIPNNSLCHAIQEWLLVQFLVYSIYDLHRLHKCILVYTAQDSQKP